MGTASLMPRQPLKVCAEPSCPELTPTTRCVQHAREADKARGTKTERGYGKQHTKLRARWKRIVEAGQANCSRCGRRIHPGTEWALDHADDRMSYLGASHKLCNDRAGGINSGISRRT